MSMNEIRKRMLEMVGASEEDTKPSNDVENAIIELAEMIADQENAICELAELIGGEEIG